MQDTALFISSPLLWDFSTKDIFLKAYEQRMGLELFHQHMDLLEVKPEDILALREQYPVDLFLHAYSWDLNLSSLHREIRELSVKLTKKSIDFAKAIGAKDVTIHFGRETIFISPGFYDRLMKESIDELLDYSQQVNQPISFEIMEPVGKEFVTHYSDVKRIVGDLWEDFPITLDLAHCRSTENIKEFVAAIPKIVKFHISNYDRGKYHTALPDGDIDFKALKDLLISQHVPFVMEGIEYNGQTHLLNKNIHFMEENYHEIF